MRPSLGLSHKACWLNHLKCGDLYFTAFWTQMRSLLSPHVASSLEAVTSIAVIDRNSLMMPNPNLEYCKWKQITKLGIETIFCKKLPEKWQRNQKHMFHLHHNCYPDLSWSSSGANVKLNISQHCKTLPVWFQATSLLHIGQTGFGWPRSVPSRLWPWMHVQSTRVNQERQKYILSSHMLEASLHRNLLVSSVTFVEVWVVQRW